MYSGFYITDNYVHSNVHCLAFEGDPHRKDGCILSFYMVGEVFAKIKLPDLRIYENEYECVVAVGCNESLALIVYPIGASEYLVPTSFAKCFDMWVMQEYGDDTSRTKLTIGPIASIVALLDFWRNGKFFLEDDSGYIFSYNPSTQKISMEKLCFGAGLHLYQSCIYSDSLVSVTGNAPSDFKILSEDISFVITPDMKRVLDYIDHWK